MKHKIDAKGKKLGRVATEVASLLMGKTTPDFERNILSSNTVEILNASLLDIDESKLKNKKYKRYSGYPGGLKEETMERVISKKGHKEILKKAVYGMLPSNKMRSKMMLNLTVKD